MVQARAHYTLLFLCIHGIFPNNVKDNEWTLDQQQNDAYSDSPEQTSILWLTKKLLHKFLYTQGMLAMNISREDINKKVKLL